MDLGHQTSHACMGMALTTINHASELYNPVYPNTHPTNTIIIRAMNSLLLLLLLLLPLVISTLVHAGTPRRSLQAAEDTIMQFLNPHNAVRARAGVPPLQWSTKLESYARWYADQRRKDCALIHSTADYGENLFWGKGRQWTIADAVGAWAAQRAYYDYGRNQCQTGKDCLHYTQMVWRTTKFLGCARIACDNGDTYVACEYDPHGNFIGQRPY